MTTWSAHWSALGTGVDVFVDRHDRLEPARRLVEDELDRIDRACSRFRDDSELSGVSRRAGRWVDVSPLCLEAVEAGLRAARLTGGAVDPTVGRSLRLLGYDRDFDELGRPRGAAPAARERGRVGDRRRGPPARRRAGAARRRARPRRDGQGAGRRPRRARR